MSLTEKQHEDTIAEFAENIERTGVTFGQIAQALGGTERYARRVAELKARNLEDPWVLRNYLLAQADARGVSLRPFTALSGDYHRYWFLDGAYIDRGRFAA